MKRVGVFIGCLLVFAGLAWIGGFDYDKRGFWVAWCAFMAITLSALFATIP